ncbi:MAG: histidine phosphatase family protein [Bdellovibrionaceae bacterium]|nr:histidine phosphatase family protein [Pseudobdellovibrionaceae bacterium]
MKVYLFRHGQKDSVPLKDPDLTRGGHEQANRIAALITSGDFFRGTQFLTSPRLRAQRTLMPAAQLCQSQVQIVTDLDQREPFETSEFFRARIQKFVLSLEKKFSEKDIIYLCTHHDWIEESLSLIAADTDLLETRYWHWNPAQFMEFDILEGLWILRRFERIQT